MIEPGIYPGLSYAEYEAVLAIRQSEVKEVEPTPLHAHERILHPPAPSPALDLGSATHCAALEPEKFPEEWVRGLTESDGRPLARRSNVAKAKWAEFEAKHSGKGILSAGDWDIVTGIQKSLQIHSLARELLYGSKGHNELTLVWDDREHGCRMKARMDRVTTYEDCSVLIDLKTTRDCSPGGFSRSAANFGYHCQSACYLDGADTLSPRPRRFLFIAVEKAPPYAVAVYELDNEAIEEGFREYSRRLALYLQCKESNVWPGYPDRIQSLALPKWATRRIDD